MRSTTNILNNCHIDAIKALSGSGLFVEDSEMEKNIGCIIKYINWEPSMGTIARDYNFTVIGVQKNWRGEIVYRVLCNDGHDTFGRCAHIDEIEFI